VPEIFGSENVKAAAGKPELIGGSDRCEGVLLERF